jgi:hypothetical protein
VRTTAHVNGTFRVEECPSSFLNECASGFCQLCWVFPVANEQTETALLLDLHDLFAESRLRDPESFSGSREIQFIGQNHSCIEMAKFNLRKEHAEHKKVSNHLTQADARRTSALVTEWSQ